MLLGADSKGDLRMIYTYPNWRMHRSERDLHIIFIPHANHLEYNEMESKGNNVSVSSVWCLGDVIHCRSVNIHMERPHNIIPSAWAIHASMWSILSIPYHMIKLMYAVKVG